jgi:hypothetical protein
VILDGKLQEPCPTQVAVISLDRACSFRWNLAVVDDDLLWEKNVVSSLKSIAEVMLTGWESILHRLLALGSWAQSQWISVSPTQFDLACVRYQATSMVDPGPVASPSGVDKDPRPGKQSTAAGGRCALMDRQTAMGDGNGLPATHNATAHGRAMLEPWFSFFFSVGTVPN